MFSSRQLSVFLVHTCVLVESLSSPQPALDHNVTLSRSPSLSAIDVSDLGSSDSADAQNLGPPNGVPTLAADHDFHNTGSNYSPDAKDESSSGVPRRPTSLASTLWKKLKLAHHIKQGAQSVINAFFGLSESLKSAGVKIAGFFVQDPDMQELVAMTVSWITLGALVLTVVGTLGVDIKPLLSLSTLAGFAISISAKQILSDTFSAAYVIWIRPFRRGDTIAIEEMGKNARYEGEVLSVDYHFVRLKMTGGKEVMLPTHQAYGKVVERAQRPAGND